MLNKKIAIIGAGPAGLMAAEVLSKAIASGWELHVYEQKPSAARKFLMAGKTGLNISHAEDLEQFVQRYDHAEWLRPWVEQWNAEWIQQWMQGLGIESYTGSSGRIFPVEMKAAPLLRAWLKRLNDSGVQFHYRHQLQSLQGRQLQLLDLRSNLVSQTEFDAIVLACGAVSWSQLGSDGAWQQWLNADELEAFQPSNAGVCIGWSDYMQPVFGQPLKRVEAWVLPEAGRSVQKSQGDIVVTHYGLESGLIYRQGRALRAQMKQAQCMELVLDLLPDQSVPQLAQKLKSSAKQSLSNVWRKAGLDAAKSALVRELVNKSLWHSPDQLAQQIKHLTIPLKGFRPIDEAISCAGGVRQQALTEHLQLKSSPAVFCCGEMLDWDAPTGGYLLTACFATGRAAGHGVLNYLNVK